MKHFAKLLMIASFGIAAFGYAQNYGNDQGYQQQGYYSQPQYAPQGQYQGQPRYQDNRMNQGYDQDGSASRSRDQSSWSNWFRGDDKNQNIPDEAVNEMVLRNLLSTPYFSRSAKNLVVTTKEGKVTLKGKVANKNEKNQIEYMVKNVPGVKSVSIDVETER